MITFIIRPILGSLFRYGHFTCNEEDIFACFEWEKTLCEVPNRITKIFRLNFHDKLPGKER